MPELSSLLSHRFRSPPDLDKNLENNELAKQLAGRGSCRKFQNTPVSAQLIETLCALALCAPTKSDLQQRDIVIVDDNSLRGKINALLSDSPWVATAPAFLVFCGNNRRHRQMHAWHEREFVNDHLDAFFNAAVDAGIALSAFVIAAENAGLGCCPISAIRNHANEVSSLLNLPDFVFPVAGLALGYPETEAKISLRLQLDATVHRNRFDDDSIRSNVAAYDRRRENVQSYETQRFEGRFGRAADYSWSDDKTRQYSELERADFGSHVRAKGFKLD